MSHLDENLTHSSLTPQIAVTVWHTNARVWHRESNFRWKHTSFQAKSHGSELNVPKKEAELMKFFFETNGFLVDFFKKIPQQSTIDIESTTNSAEDNPQ